MSTVEAIGVSKFYGAVVALKDVSLQFGEGEFFGLLGPSGSGKTTLLRCIAGFVDPDEGEIRFDGRPVRRTPVHRRDIGMVFQDFGLFPNMNVLENVMSGPLLVQKQDKKSAREKAIGLLERVGLADKIHSASTTLSGGQKQRVAIARALAMSPKLMLFDEPTSALDPELVGEVLDVIKELADEGMTMLIVTHEIEFARRVADTVAFLHDGYILESGPPQSVLDNPREERTKQFLARVFK